MTDSSALAHEPRDPFGENPGEACPAALSWLLDAVRSAAADTGGPTTQHALDAALLALEDALIRLGAPGASLGGGAR